MRVRRGVRLGVVVLGFGLAIGYAANGIAQSDTTTPASTPTTAAGPTTAPPAATSTPPAAPTTPASGTATPVPLAPATTYAKLQIFGGGFRCKSPMLKMAA